jgi:hypothetical protein
MFDKEIQFDAVMPYLVNFKFIYSVPPKILRSYISIIYGPIFVKFGR